MTPSPDPLAPPPDDGLARRRFRLMSACRLAGMAMVVLGMLAIAGRLAWPEWLGQALVAAGAMAAFLAPTLLARRWRSERRR